jgi:sugar lactone lactonase YvrE
MVIELLRKIVFLFLGIGIAASLNGQTADVGFGDWRAYVSHRNGLSVATRKTETVMVSNVGVVYFDASKGIYKEFTRVDGLSASDPQKVYYDAVHDYFLIAYPTGLVDYIRDFSSLSRNNSTVRTYRDLFLTPNYPTKKIYGFYAHGRFVYIATDFGIVAWDVTRNETRYTYTQIGTNTAEAKIKAVAVHNNRLFALTEDLGLFSASLSAPNLADGKAWRREHGSSNSLPEGKPTLITANDERMVVYMDLRLYVQEANETTWIDVTHNDFISNNPVGLQAVSGGFVLSDVYFNALYQNGSYQRLPNSFSPSDVKLSDDQRMIAMSDFQSGLFVLNLQNGDTLLVMKGGLPNNLCADIGVGNSQLYIGSSSENRGAPSYDLSGVYYMNLNDRKWVILNKDKGLDKNRCNNSNGYLFFDKNSNRAYVAAWDCGLNVLENGQLQKVWDRTNICLKGIGGSSPQDFIRVKGMDTDSKGNLWVITNAAVEPIACITKDEKCYSYRPIPNVSNQLWNMTVDKTDQLWIVNRREGVVVYTQKGTLDNADYSHRVLRSGKGFGNLPSDEVMCFAEDQDGVMWVGTSGGVCAFYSPSTVISSQTIPDAVLPIYQGQYLLKTDRVNHIAIDGANRKWFATDQSGVYLFNKDCTEQIAHFTTTNSPLLSNRIYKIAIDEINGEVFFATERGVVSYQDIVTGGKENNDNLTVFPNPYYTDNANPVVIRGTMNQAVVKITSVSGLLVRELTAQGGQALWDGKDIRGKQVQSGVYLIFVSTDEGNSPNIAKLTILNRE